MRRASFEAGVRYASGKFKVAFRTVTADNSVMNVDEVRDLLRKALAERGASPTALSVRLLGRSEGYVSDFLTGKKQSIGAAETALLEKALGLAPGSLVVNARSNAAPQAAVPPTRPRESAAPPPAGTSLMDTLRSPEQPETPESQSALEAALDVAIRRLWAFLSPDEPPRDGVIFALVRSAIADYEARKALTPHRPKEEN
jgi:hypothetical protein